MYEYSNNVGGKYIASHMTWRTLQSNIPFWHAFYRCHWSEQHSAWTAQIFWCKCCTFSLNIVLTLQSVSIHSGPNSGLGRYLVVSLVFFSCIHTQTDRQANLSKISWLNCAKYTQWYCLPGMEGQVIARPTTAHRLQRYLYYDLWCTVVERMGWGRREGWWTDYPMQMRAPVIIQELISRITYWLDHLKGIILYTKPNWTVLIPWSNVTQGITINFDQRRCERITWSRVCPYTCPYIDVLPISMNIYPSNGA